MRPVLIVVAVVALAACQKPATNAPPANAANAPANVAVAATPTAASTVAPVAPAGESYPISVTLSPAATAQLQTLGQNVIVSANYFGNANAKGRSLQNRDGQISLGDTQNVNMPGAGATTITVVPYDHNLLADLDGPPQVNINVFSGVGVTPANKLNCTMFQDNLSVAEAKGVQISCTLTSEMGAGN
jgi:hypothetical protein